MNRSHRYAARGRARLPAVRFPKKVERSFRAIVTRSPGQPHRSRLFVASILLASSGCGGAAEPGGQKNVTLSVFVPGTGELSVQYACPYLAAPPKDFGAGPVPAFQTVTIQRGRSTFFISTPKIPDRFCVSGTYEGKDASGPFNIFEVTSADDGLYWFRDHGDARPSSPNGRPVSIAVSAASPAKEIPDNARNVRLLGGDLEVTYRSGLAIQVSFTPQEDGLDARPALQQLRVRLGVHTGLNVLSAESVCRTFGSSLKSRLDELGLQDPRRKLLEPYLSSCSMDRSREGGIPARSEYFATVGNPRPLPLGSAGGWAFRPNFARGEGVLTDCEIEETPCVTPEPSVPGPRFGAIALGSGNADKIVISSKRADMVAVYYDDPDLKDSIFFITAKLHAFNLRGLQ